MSLITITPLSPYVKASYVGNAAFMQGRVACSLHASLVWTRHYTPKM